MRRPHRNASVLILTCLIQRADGSQMSNLISAIGYIRFSPLRVSRYWSKPLSFSGAASAPALCVGLMPPHPRE
jgi:hypothetical protein